jgi:Zn-dependent protease
VDTSNLIQTVLIYALPVLFAITVHEAAHGYAARHFGDTTAWMLGRITLNPMKHIDPVVFRHLGCVLVRLRQTGTGAL